MVLIFLFISITSAQNPIIRNQFSADPSARVFEGKVYVYPSHDILPKEGKGRPNWFCMEDYHVFSSDNLIDWTDHGVIISQETVPWVNPKGYAMWAPDCIYKNGKYYFYFPAPAKDTAIGRGFTIGVAVAEKPYGPFIPQEKPIEGVRGIDPNVFIDKDGQAYLYWSSRNIFGVKLKDNMVEIEGEPVTLQDLPSKGLKEGPYMFERNGIYYLTYPHVQDSTERLEYAISDNPLGPFKVTGVIMDQRLECWTNHHSIIEYKDQWYLFYHYNDYSPEFDKNRSVRIDNLFFNEDGTIKPVKATLRGVGIANATSEIQIDRYSEISSEGVRIDFINSNNKFEGWKTILEKENSWIRFNSVNFTDTIKTISVKVQSKNGGNLQLNLNDLNNSSIAQIEISPSAEWKVITVPVMQIKSEINDIILQLKSKSNIEVDWIRFNK
ncbi:MAG: family 43 glycosylhydrolase [Ignavibacteria bacterium]|nr:family 43 glycosylhydrolase [Ignavibacteria bacterium]